MEKLIVLAGGSSYGKTQTLLKVIDELDRRYPTAIITYYRYDDSSATFYPYTKDNTKDNKKDVFAIIKLTNLTVGVSTGGDNARAILRTKDFFDFCKCEIGFCASRAYKSAGGSFVAMQDYVKELLAQDIDVIPYYKNLHYNYEYDQPDAEIENARNNAIVAEALLRIAGL